MSEEAKERIQSKYAAKVSHEFVDAKEFKEICRVMGEDWARRNVIPMGGDGAYRIPQWEYKA